MERRRAWTETAIECRGNRTLRTDADRCWYLQLNDFQFGRRCRFYAVGLILLFNYSGKHECTLPKDQEGSVREELACILLGAYFLILHPPS